MRLGLRACAALGCLLTLSPALSRAAPDNRYLQEAKVFYDELEFDRCQKRLALAAGERSSSAELVEIEIYGGLCAYQLGDRKAATEHFRLALKLDASAKLPPLTSPKIAQLFDSLRKQVAESPSVQASPPPPVSTVVAPPPPAISKPAERSWIRPVPLTLSGVSLLAAGAAAYFGLEAKRLEGRANDAAYDDDFRSLGDRGERSALYANVALGVAVSAAAGAVLTYVLGD
jgi:hypothetical protein